MESELSAKIDAVLAEIRQIKSSVQAAGGAPASMSLEEAVRYTGLPNKSFGELIRANRIIPFTPPGCKRRRFARSALDELIKSLNEGCDPRKDMDFG